ncbi:MAG: hypothetical protein MZV63_53245 [Marinilabiliales bacterium]|nr:hypothetical protein [Marinilabiliales bacterium]
MTSNMPVLMSYGTKERAISAPSATSRGLYLLHRLSEVLTSQSPATRIGPHHGPNTNLILGKSSV